MHQQPNKQQLQSKHPPSSSVRQASPHSTPTKHTIPNPLLSPPKKPTPSNQSQSALCTNPTPTPTPSFNHTYLFIYAYIYTGQQSSKHVTISSRLNSHRPSIPSLTHSLTQSISRRPEHYLPHNKHHPSSLPKRTRSNVSPEEVGPRSACSQ